MARRVLSIEIGPQMTKAVVIDYLRKNPHVYNVFSFPTPEEAIDDGYIKNKNVMAKALKEHIKDNGIKEKHVVFSIASSKIATREVVVPFVNESKLAGLIKATAQDYFPINMDEYTLAYSVVDTVKEKDKKKLKVSLLAAPDTLIQNYYSFAKELGLEIASLDYYGNSSMQVLKRHVISGHCICVQMGTRSTMVIVMKDGQQIMQRTIPYGTEFIVETMIESEALDKDSYTSTFEMLCRENVIYSTLDYEDMEAIHTARMTEEQWKRSHQTQEMRKAVTDAVGNILLNIIRVIDYFHSKYPGIELTSAYITGAGVKIRGIETLFENELGIIVHKLDSLTNISFARNLTLRLDDQTEYIAAIGAAIEPIGFRLKSLAENEKHRENMRSARLIFALSIFVALVLVGTAALKYNSSVQDNKDLKAQKASLSYINKIYNENKMAKSKNSEAQAIYDATKNHNSQLNDVIKSIEKKLPTCMKVSNFTSSNEGIAMTITTTTKISVARMLINLEEIKELTNYQIPSVTEEGEDGKSYSFSVTASYALSEEEKAEQEAEAAKESSTDTDASNGDGIKESSSAQ